ncbi:HAD family phosphatase [Aquihabitans sp. G128]|uniref:HAD family hydrolase n=1 Tax=Aquihabitans sp. G128 TaxID=2849779 RepID=UPI001C249708|nr:HAD family phosphatase [Aquihabitans sp. G128]QXC60698.1 HAD family phosphatase [Aquihabitans sp. G128]
MVTPEPPPTVDALLFDLGGVVFGIDFDRAVRHWEASAHLEPGALVGRFTVDDAYERHERAHLDTAGYLAHLRTTLGVDLSDDELAAGWNDIYLGPLPGMAELVARAAAVLPTYAFTNTNVLHQSAWEPRFAAELAAFRHVFSSSTIGLRKPEEAAFRHVADEVGVPLERILFFDDTAENVDAARALGMPAVLVRSPADVTDALAALGID